MTSSHPHDSPRLRQLPSDLPGTFPTRWVLPEIFQMATPSNPIWKKLTESWQVTRHPWKMVATTKTRWTSSVCCVFPQENPNDFHSQLRTLSLRRLLGRGRGGGAATRFKALERLRSVAPQVLDQFWDHLCLSLFVLRSGRFFALSNFRSGKNNYQLKKHIVLGAMRFALKIPKIAVWKAFEVAIFPPPSLGPRANGRSSGPEPHPGQQHFGTGGWLAMRPTTVPGACWSAKRSWSVTTRS